MEPPNLFYLYPHLCKSRLQGWGFSIINKVSAEGDYLIMTKIVSDGVREEDTPAIMYRRGVDSSTLKFIDESFIMIGSHATPGTKAYLAIKLRY